MSFVGMTVPQMRRRCCTVNGKEHHLEPMATALLACLLLSHPGVYISVDELAIAMWGAEGGPLRPNLSIKVYVNRLRDIGVVIEVLHSRGAAKQHLFNGYRIPAEHRGSRLRKVDRILIPRLRRRSKDYLFFTRGRPKKVQLAA